MSILSNLKKGATCFFYIFLIFFVIILGSAAGFFIQIKRQLPDLSILKEYEPSLITRLYSADGQSIAHFCLEKRILVSYDSLPPHLIQAVIAVEDARFYKHKGLDWEGITRAAFRNLKHMHFVEGGSTITQQLTRSLILHSEKTVIRKFKELLLAMELEKVYSKEKIIEMYLNQIYLGNGAYGVESAARTFFGKHIEDVDLPEAALLAGLPKAPSTYNPYRNPERALDRRDYVLKRMLEEGYIDHRAYQGAINTPLNLNKNKSSITLASYFTEYIRRYLEEQYGATALYRGGLKVYTTLDLKAQEYAEKALRWGIEKLDRRQGFRKITDMESIDTSTNVASEALLESCIKSGKIPEGQFLGRIVDLSPIQASVQIEGTDKKGILNLEDASWIGEESLESILRPADRIYVRVLEIFTDPNAEKERPDILFRLALEQKPEVQGALIAIDPKTGHIKAMVGGYDFATSKFNRSVQAKRQPGSAFKPFIYETALKQGCTLADIFIDSPIIYQDEMHDKDWKPVNYYQKFFGPTTLREALEKSRNVITIKILNKVGIEETIETARKMGISSPLAPDLSLALGSSGVSLLELTAAYGIFATGGIKLKPIAITRVEGADGRILEEHYSQSERVLDEQSAYLMTQALRGVVDNGTGWRAKALGRPVAGKTGTTNNYIDAWFVGFIPDLVAGAWVGFDEYRSLGDMETGSKAAAPIWVRFMKEYLKNKPVKDFPIPADIQFVPIDLKTGLLATPECPAVFMEVFRKGYEPEHLCKVHKIGNDHFVNIDMNLSSKASQMPQQDPMDYHNIIDSVHDSD